MTTCYDCTEQFDLSPSDVFFLVGYGDFIIEHHDGVHVLVNIDNCREFELEDFYA